MFSRSRFHLIIGCLAIFIAVLLTGALASSSSVDASNIPGPPGPTSAVSERPAAQSSCAEKIRIANIYVLPSSFIEKGSWAHIRFVARGTENNEVQTVNFRVNITSDQSGSRRVDNMGLQEATLRYQGTVTRDFYWQADQEPGTYYIHASLSDLDETRCHSTTFSADPYPTKTLTITPPPSCAGKRVEITSLGVPDKTPTGATIWAGIEIRNNDSQPWPVQIRLQFKDPSNNVHDWETWDNVRVAGEGTARRNASLSRRHNLGVGTHTLHASVRSQNDPENDVCHATFGADPYPVQTFNIVQRPRVDSTGCSPETVDVGESVTCNPGLSGAPASTYDWSASGGSSSSGEDRQFSTSWNSDGEKRVSLRACDALSCDSESQEITVSPPPPPPPRPRLLQPHRFPPRVWIWRKLIHAEQPRAPKR